MLLNPLVKQRHLDVFQDVELLYQIVGLENKTDFSGPYFGKLIIGQVRYTLASQQIFAACDMIKTTKQTARLGNNENEGALLIQVEKSETNE